MTNKERYKQAFSTLHASQPILLEEINMEKTNKRFKMRPALAAGLAAALIVGCMGVAFAADVGGIQQTVKMWFGGNAVEAQVEDNSTDTVGAYQYTMPDRDGNLITVGAGGTTIDDDGTEHPMTAEELAESFAVEVAKKDDGTVWLYDHDQAYDITGYLADGQDKFVLNVDDQTVYYNFMDEDLSYSRFFEPTSPVDQYIPLA